MGLLGLPIGMRTDRSEFLFVNRLLTGRMRRQKQELFLNRRAKQIEIQNLRHPWLGHATQPCEFRDARHFAAIQHALILNRQGHQS